MSGQRPGASSSIRRRRVRAVAVVLSIVAAAVVGLACAVQPPDKERGGPAQGGDAPSPATSRDDGPTRVIPPASGSPGRLVFPLGALARARIVAAWLQRGRDRRPVSVRTVSRATRRAELPIPRPAGWSGDRIRLIIRTASRSGVYGCGYGRFARGRWPAGCWRPYSAASPFNQPLPEGARPVGNSGQLVRRILGFGPAREPRGRLRRHRGGLLTIRRTGRDRAIPSSDCTAIKRAGGGARSRATRSGSRTRHARRRAATATSRWWTRIRAGSTTSTRWAPSRRAAGCSSSAGAGGRGSTGTV